MERRGRTDRRVRADARRNIDALLEAAKAVFAVSGVDAPVREIAEKAGVGVGHPLPSLPRTGQTWSRRFFAAKSTPVPLPPTPWRPRMHPTRCWARWLHRYTNFIATKRGLAAALHSGDAAFDALPAYFRRHLEPALKSLLDSAVAAGVVCSDVEPFDLLRAVGNLCLPAGKEEAGHTRRMVDLLIDGLRYGAAQSGPARPSE